MTESQLPFVKSVFHPSDFSPAGEAAFAHALAVALIRETSLTILHAGDAVEEDWARFPAVRTTLERWGLLEPGSPRRAVFEQLSIAVTKVNAKGQPIRATRRFLEKHEPELIVLATEGREGLSRWLRPSVAQRITRRARTLSLFVPTGGRGFVSPDDGTLTLQRILIPVDVTPDPSRAIEYATRAADALGDGFCEIRLLHVGGEMPAVSRPEGERWSYQEQLLEGDAVESILEASAEVDLVVMATDGRDGPLDIFRGSHTERVVRAVGCPILAVPGFGTGS